MADDRRDEIDIDREAHALCHALLVRVDTDLDVEHEIVHKHPVRDVGFMGYTLWCGPP